MGYRIWTTSKHFCECCVLGKEVRTHFQKKVEYWTRISLKVVHTDICGQITLKSFIEKKYFIIFIDDCTRET